MRIGTGVQLPLPPSLAGNGMPASATMPDRASLLGAATLASASSWALIGPSMDAAPAGDRVAAALSAQWRDSLVIAAAPLGSMADPESPLATGTAATLMSAAPPAPTGIAATLSGQPSPSLANLSLTANAAATLAAVVSGDRLSLSATTAALRSEPVSAGGKPPAEFTLNLLTALTGEPRSRLQLLAFGTQTPADPAAVAGLAAKGATELLQLLVRGTVHSADARQIDLTLGMSLQRQAGASALDRTTLDAIRATLDQLARTEIKLDYPGNAAALAGHSARFQAVLDPLGLWPMQSFLLSGLLILGQAWDDDEVAELDEEDSAALSQDREEQDQPSEQQQPKQEAQALVADEPTPLPADGGLPIISANRWLELELRHWRSQLRQWMALPAE